jgi:hypothetical protein
VLGIDDQVPIWKLLDDAKEELRLSNRDICLIRKGEIIEPDMRVSDSGIRDSDILTLMPLEIEAALDENELVKEYGYIKEQFPLVRMEDLMTYRGQVRCDRGYVKELATRGIWPFTQYVQWHEFRMELSYLHPFKPPIVTWVTDIDHPNIIPAKKGKVCVSILGKKWLPNTKLAAVINALFFLLSDPNPYSAYRNDRCKEAAKICRMYGFPLKRRDGIAKPPEFRGR